MADQTIARRCVIRGRVQGVSFRAWTREAAEARGLGGWVRNRDDGTVEAVLEGDPALVRDMLDALASGPAAARVDAVEAEEAAPTGAAGFEIRA